MLTSIATLIFRSPSVLNVRCQRIWNGGIGSNVTWKYHAWPSIANGHIRQTRLWVTANSASRRGQIVLSASPKQSFHTGHSVPNTINKQLVLLSVHLNHLGMITSLCTQAKCWLGPSQRPWDIPHTYAMQLPPLCHISDLDMIHVPNLPKGENRCFTGVLQVFYRCCTGVLRCLRERNTVAEQLNYALGDCANWCVYIECSYRNI